DRKGLDRERFGDAVGAEGRGEVGGDAERLESGWGHSVAFVRRDGDTTGSGGVGSRLQAARSPAKSVVRAKRMRMTPRAIPARDRPGYHCLRPGPRIPSPVPGPFGAARPQTPLRGDVGAGRSAATMEPSCGS